MAQNEEDDLTVDDILDAEQTAEAAAADEGSAPEGAGPASDSGEEVGNDEADNGNGRDSDTPAVEGAEPLDDPENPYLEDLRRITAEYANYRRRTEANSVIEKQRATAAAVTPLLDVLDDLDRAEAHGDLTEGSAFATIAQKIRGTLQRMGLESFGEKGEAFDPQVHEAIAQVPVPGTEEATVLDVIERGYRIGDVELRPAKVAVAVDADG